MLSENDTLVTPLANPLVIYSTIPELLALFFLNCHGQRALIAHQADPPKT
jgi:hypothetical protein